MPVYISGLTRDAIDLHVVVCIFSVSLVPELDERENYSMRM